MPKININGVTRDMNPEEVAETERLAEELPTPEPSAEERLAAQQKEIADLKEALELLLSGVTEDA